MLNLIKLDIEFYILKDVFKMDYVFISVLRVEEDLG